MSEMLPFLVFSHSTVCLILLFSQYLSKVDVPMIAYKDKKWTVFQYPLFKLFSVSCQHYPGVISSTCHTVLISETYAS